MKDEVLRTLTFCSARLTSGAVVHKKLSFSQV